MINRSIVLLPKTALLFLVLACALPLQGQERELEEDSKARFSPPLLELLVGDLQGRIGDDAWRRLLSDPVAGPGATAVISNIEWMRELLDSGPIPRPEASIRFLSTVLRRRPEIAQSPIARSMASACALEVLEKPEQIEALLQRLDYYLDSHKRGLLNSCFDDLLTWERRFLTRYQGSRGYGSLESFVFLRDNLSLPRHQYNKACWRAPYRLHNSLGDSVHRPMYYKPFEGVHGSHPEMVIDVGGVCGALSTLGTAASIANGVPALTMGEPGHCAYAVKTKPGHWQPSYSLSWKRSLHFTFHDREWDFLLLMEACFMDPVKTAESNDLARRARTYERAGRLAAADRLYRKAVKAHPVNYTLWTEWAEFGSKTSQSLSWWKRFESSVVVALSEYPPAMWAPLIKHSYPALMAKAGSRADSLKTAKRYLGHLSESSHARWRLEGVCKSLRSKLPKDMRNDMLSLMSRELCLSKSVGGRFVSWALGIEKKSSPKQKQWLLNELLQSLSGGSQDADAGLRTLAATVIPQAMKDGDVVTFQAVGEAVQRLSKAPNWKKTTPFKGTLLSKGGLLRLNGEPAKRTQPHLYWGVLSEHGGHCRIDKGPNSSIDVQLKNRGRLTGVEIYLKHKSHSKLLSGATIEVSQDGKEWVEVGKLKGNSRIISMAVPAETDCRWVRVRKADASLQLTRFLVYGHRRS